MIVIRIIAAVFMVAGLALLWAAHSEFDAQRRFVERSHAAAAEVVGVTPYRTGGRRSSTRYRFTLRFATDRGDSVEAAAMKSSSSPRFAEGEGVRVRYARSHPWDVEIDDFAQLWGDAVILAVLGAAFFGAGAASFWIAGGKPTSAASGQATLTEMLRARREGRLGRDSPFQAVLIALTLVGFFMAAGTILLALFAPWPVKLIVGGALAFVAWNVVRGWREASRSLARPERRKRRR